MEDLSEIVSSIVKDIEVKYCVEAKSYDSMDASEAVQTVEYKEGMIEIGRDDSNNPLYTQPPEGESDEVWKSLTLQRWPNIGMRIYTDPVIKKRALKSWKQVFTLLDAADALWPVERGFTCTTVQVAFREQQSMSVDRSIRLAMNVHDQIIPIGVGDDVAYAGIRRSEKDNKIEIAVLHLDVPTLYDTKYPASWRSTGLFVQDCLWLQYGDKNVIAAVIAVFDKELLGKPVPVSDRDPGYGITQSQLYVFQVNRKGGSSKYGRRELFPKGDAAGMPALLACNEHYLVVSYIRTRHIPAARTGVWVYNFESGCWIQVYEDRISALNLTLHSLIYADLRCRDYGIHILNLEQLFASGDPDPSCLTTHVSVWAEDPIGSDFKSATHEPIRTIYQEPGRIFVTSENNCCLLSYGESGGDRVISRDFGPCVDAQLYGNRVVVQKKNGLIMLLRVKTLAPFGRWDDDRVISTLIPSEELDEQRKGDRKVTARIEDCYRCLAQSCNRIISLLPNGVTVFLWQPATERD